MNCKLLEKHGNAKAERLSTKSGFDHACSLAPQLSTCSSCNGDLELIHPWSSDSLTVSPLFLIICGNLQHEVSKKSHTVAVTMGMGQNWGASVPIINPIFFGCLNNKWLNSLMAHESRFLKALGQDYALAGLVKRILNCTGCRDIGTLGILWISTTQRNCVV